MSRKEKVIRVIVGDAFETATRKKSVRLANVDAPEKGQRASTKPTEALRKMIEGEEIRIETVGRDKYGRAVAKVYKGRESVNKKMQEKPK